MTDRINEALRRTGLAEFMVNEDTEPEHVRIVREAARAYVADWVTCPTCNGSGEIDVWNLEDGHKMTPRPCPDCVGGLVPSAELVERVAKAIDRTQGQPLPIRQARAALLASRQGDTR